MNTTRERTRVGPAHPWLGRAAEAIARPIVKAYAASRSFHTPDSAYARERGAALTARLRRGEPVYLLGIGPAGHDSGVALVEVTPENGVRLLSNNEEERYSAIRHCTLFPRRALDETLATMARAGIGPDQIHACLGSWDFVTLAGTLLRGVAEELPGSRAFLNPRNFDPMNGHHIERALRSAPRLGKQLGLGRPMPIIGMRHHCNHAWFSYAVSPFAGGTEPVLITVLDGIGDDGAISIYLGQGQQVTLLHRNRDIFDSLGGFYSLISSTQGGWTILSSEGRYMGAAAWGDNDRLTNPYYRPLREVFHFTNDGDVKLNRRLAHWPTGAQLRPYTPALRDILGPPIPLDRMWNPDAVMRVEVTGEIAGRQERFDKAAATQLVFEDALFHLISHWVRTTGASKLVLTGGTALNAVANMRLLQHFDTDFYHRALGKPSTRLHLWVPPVPGDAGVAAGAAFQFALRHGATLGPKLKHAFYCGAAPGGADIRSALSDCPDIGWVSLGSVAGADSRGTVADLLAYCIAHDGVLGLYQGAAETGPRALGHRSILANPCKTDTLATVNRLVKVREPFRPLAPMVTPEQANRWFDLAEGASDDDYNAYNYMVLTVRARPEAYQAIPAVIHRDGTSRIQIVRNETDPFTYAYLKAMGRRLGVEVSVNTSLNVAGPIAQTPMQALETLRRSKAMDGLLLIADEGDAYLAWHTVDVPPKDGGRRLAGWRRAWKAETARPGP